MTIEPDSIRFVTRGVTPEEVAAVTAVLTAAIAEAEAAARDARPPAGPDAWARSQRALRTPLTPGPGAWRSFAG
ncbi:MULTISPECIES: acyl-CoA carboxylase epsilon subunit [unclassified Leifsonia]|uniref:acyl-CoA carboxylase epsilon subunit n=1 Tax=unclassified Leifsonia TaxID=2663824 RepID=UPI00117ABFA3|nr:acyl-CoA carboxylase epsilon subunit [Leifsonia sp. NCR5]